MIVQAFVDGFTVYDSRMADDYTLTGLRATVVLNKGGTAEITMPPGHPAYNRFISYRSIVEIYRNQDLLFRGRALYPSDDFYNRRTITCEGERCFLRDSAMRPYIFQDSPAVIFAEIIAQHNTQVDESKQFRVGTITAEDPNDYLLLESERAEQCLDTLDKLVGRVGGYVVFTTDTDGRRVINWLQTLGYRSQQPIEFGSNLLDFSRSGETPDLATRIIPYGAKNEETGERVTIMSVNGGLDYIEDPEAVALRGIITKPVYYDDVTLPENLLTRGQRDLAASKMVITSLELSAVDLSAMDRDIDDFQVGDLVPVLSRPHNVDDEFLLQQRTYDLLDPAQDTVQLGKERLTLTGADVAGDRGTLDELHRTEHQIKEDYALNIGQAVESAMATLATLIQQTSESIMLEVSQTYAVNGDVQKQISSAMTQLAESFTFEFTKLEAKIGENDANAQVQFETIRKYIRLDGGNIILGEDGNTLTLRIEKDRISFQDDGAEVAYFSNKQLFVTDGYFLNSLRVGKFAWLPRQNGNLSLVKVG